MTYLRIAPSFSMICSCGTVVARHWLPAAPKLAALMIVLGDCNDAVDLYREALLFPGPSTMGHLLMQHGLRARAALSRVRKQQPADPQSMLHEQVAHGHDRAECLLGLLEAYCKATGMAANAAKCEVLIFGGATRERKRLVEAEYRLGGAGLRVLTGNETARYLGLHYGPGVQFSACTKQLLTAGRLCDCGAVEDELHVFEECPAYKSIRAKYDGDLVLMGRSMRTTMTEAPPLALARRQLEPCCCFCACGTACVSAGTNATAATAVPPVVRKDTAKISNVAARTGMVNVESVEVVVCLSPLAASPLPPRGGSYSKAAAVGGRSQGCMVHGAARTGSRGGGVATHAGVASGTDLDLEMVLPVPHNSGLVQLVLRAAAWCLASSACFR
ncbi:hypothetical protein VOLCADRAFT_98005 [Volvox carteri f. nagariensis]|uniref:Uncharacterized protein n=1 Tax=Volvox carteri f. nagariensis TaxID=3068 RepID=D8UE74_VOLCA|nr:uncharacterized protein VOLCADRAFT_98005 [Volvox carteri f. nagariensis]EFJ41917.1 hypothetical protein VOLCADRAFT_98005 [Volvox carteri f. nagariensis]|eukprot:XP_002956954.1 hypothetical protein VOLCADRAFT_98005 [Volvox carteri f. nagariensis]